MSSTSIDHVEYQDFLKYVRRAQGNTTKTIGERATVKWQIEGETLRFCLTNGKTRNESLTWVQRFCGEFNKLWSFKTSYYTEERNSSYMLALVRDYLQ